MYVQCFKIKFPINKIKKKNKMKKKIKQNDEIYGLMLYYLIS